MLLSGTNYMVLLTQQAGAHVCLCAAEKRKKEKERKGKDMTAPRYGGGENLL